MLKKKRVVHGFLLMERHACYRYEYSLCLFLYLLSLCLMIEFRIPICDLLLHSHFDHQHFILKRKDNRYYELMDDTSAKRHCLSNQRHTRCYKILQTAGPVMYKDKLHGCNIQLRGFPAMLYCFFCSSILLIPTTLISIFNNH